jgi:hypothetical protein
MPTTPRHPNDPDATPDDFDEHLQPVAAPTPREVSLAVGGGDPAATAVALAVHRLGVPKLGFETSAEVDKLFAALAAAQGEITNAEKSAMNPAFAKDKNDKNDPGRPYATLADCWNACRGPLSKNGLAILQPPCVDGREAVVMTVLGHSSGQWMRCALALPTDSNPQRIGSAITYARRYGLCALVGIAPDADDDGEAATRAAEKTNEDRASRQSQRDKLDAAWKKFSQLVKMRDGKKPDFGAWVREKFNADTLREDRFEFATSLLLDAVAEMEEAAGKEEDAPSGKATR